MTLTDARLKEIEERANAATKGPWVGDETGIEARVDESGNPAGEDAQGYRIIGITHPPLGPDNDEEAAANGVFIGHARTDIPDLIAALRQERLEHAETRIALVLAREVILERLSFEITRARQVVADADNFHSNIVHKSRLLLQALGE